MDDSLLNIKGVCCAAVNAGIKNNDDLDSLIPLIGHIAAGEPILPFNNPENEQIKVPKP